MQVDYDILRELAWSAWDPIGLLKEGDDWRSMTYKDEYDRYLKRAFKMAVAGETEGAITGYLLGVATYDMGMGGGRISDRGKKAAAATARSVIRHVEAHRRRKT